MLFSVTNPPPGYYHYLYLREDGTPYYSGKGKDKRAWDKDHRIKLPSCESRIVITHWNLTEIGAFMLERWHIRWYGRKDLGTGILRNMTDGGDGLTNPSNATRMKMRIAKLGKPRSEETTRKIIKSRTGITLPVQTCERMSIAALSRDKASRTWWYNPITGKTSRFEYPPTSEWVRGRPRKLQGFES